VGGVSPGYGMPRPIRQDDDTSQFACGDGTLDQWLRRFARMTQAGGGARTYVTMRDAHVVGYYALAATSVQNADATPSATCGMPQPVPAVLLGRLAVDQQEHGHGLGSQLLRDAIIRTLSAAEVVGVRVLLVHAATDDARRFYLRFDFEPSPTDRLHLLLLLKDVWVNMGAA
jgi:GNAT superfamily N-acetyltransferase